MISTNGKSRSERCFAAGIGKLWKTCAGTWEYALRVVKVSRYKVDIRSLFYIEPKLLQIAFLLFMASHNRNICEFLENIPSNSPAECQNSCRARPVDNT